MSNLMIKTKRLVAISIAISMFAWSFGLSGISVALAAQAGSLIKMRCVNATPPVDPPGCDAVYYLGEDGNRYVFPNAKVYSSWYSDFSTVQEISKAELESYPILIGADSNVTYKPGTRLVKFVTDPKVYAVSKDGLLHHVASEQVAIEIFGANWATLVDDLSDAFGAAYTEGSAADSTDDYNPTTEKNAATGISVDKGITEAGPAPTPGAGGSLTISLAADTPATNIVPGNAIRVPFTKINLTASSEADATIDTWLVRRGGIGQDSAFSGVNIVDTSTNFKISDIAKSFTSEHTANFTEDFTVPAGSTKTVTLTGDMAASLSSNAGENPSLDLVSVTLKGGGNVVGTLPVVGNHQTLNGTITIGTATIQRGAYTNASTTLEVGKSNYTFFSFQIQAGSAEDMQFSQISVYQSGSASLSSDLGNLRLQQDGTEIAKAEVKGLYANFNIAPITLPKGQTKQFRVVGDLLSGSSRTIKLAVYRSDDLLAKGLTYNHFIRPTYSGTGSGSSTLLLTDNQFDISAGTLRVGRSSSVAATNIAVGNDQVLGAFEFEAKGEPVEITALTLTIASTTSSGGTIIEDALRGVKFVDSSGSALAGPTDVTDNTLQVRFSNTFTVPVGITHYKVIGNVATNGGWASNDTINAQLQTPASKITARGANTQLTITPTPSSNVTTATQTIKAAAVTVAKNSTPTNKTVIKNSTSVLIGSWTFDSSNSGEDIRITSIAVRASTTGQLNALTFKDGTTTLFPINDAPTAGANVTSTFAFTDPVIVPKGTSKALNMYANIGSSSNAGEVDAWGITSNAAVTAYGVATGNSATVTATAHNGALLTIAAGGTLTINVDSAALANRLVVFGSTQAPLADVRLKATNEDIDITQLTVRIANGALTGTASGDNTQVSKFFLKLEGNIIGNTSGYTMAAATQQVNFQRADLTIPEGTTGVKFTVLADIVREGTNEPGTDNASIRMGLSGADTFTATGNSSNQSATITYTDSTGTAVALHRAVPQVVIVTPTNKLGATAVLHTAKITAVGDDIGVYRLTYRVSTSTSVKVSSGDVKLASCNGCGGVASGSSLAGALSAGVYFIDGFDRYTFAVDSAQSHGKRYIGIALGATAQFEFSATVSLSTNADTVSTVLLGDTATTTNDTGGSEATAFGVINQGNFVWSDLNGDDSQAAAVLTTKQWYNGYLVEGLGATPTSTIVTVGE